MIEAIHDQLFAVLRDLLHSRDICQKLHALSSRDCSNLVFQLLRNAKVLNRIESFHALSVGVVIVSVRLNMTTLRLSAKNWVYVGSIFVPVAVPEL